MNSLDVNRHNMSHETTFGSTSRKFIAGDWDRDGWYFWDGEKETRLTREEFLNGKLFAEYPDSVLYIDAPHVHERRERRGGSKSQIYTRSELQRIAHLAAQYEVKIRAFPAAMDPRARDEAGVAKEDGGDVRAIHQFVIAHPEVGIQRWSLPDERKEYLWDARNNIREDMNERLNVMRGCEYRTEDHVRATNILHANFTKLSPRILEWFQIKQVKGKTGLRTDFHNGGVMGIYVAVLDADGKLRVNPEGKFIGVDTIFRIIQLHPYHFKNNASACGGGIARSNLMWHLLRNALREKDILNEDGTVKKKGNGRQPERRREFSKAVKDLIKVFRDSSQIACTLPQKQIAVTLTEGENDDLDRLNSVHQRQIVPTPGIISPMKNSFDDLQPSLFEGVV